MSALSETVERESAALSGQHKRMAAAIRERIVVAKGEEMAGWERYVGRLIAAVDAGEPILPLIEEGYWQVLFLRDELAQRSGPPKTPADWARMLVLDDADEIRLRAKVERG